MKCSNCNSEIIGGNKFCANCGSPIVSGNNNQNILTSNVQYTNDNINNKDNHAKKNFGKLFIFYIGCGCLVIIILFGIMINKIFNNMGLNEQNKHQEDSMVYSEFEWPDSDIAKLLPKPKSNIGNIYWEASYGFVIYVSETSIEDYSEYVKSCRENGFTVDYRKGEDYYYANNKDGYSLSLNYEGDNVMFIRIDEPKKNDEGSNTTNNQINKEESKNDPSNTNDEFETNIQENEKNSNKNYDIEDTLTNIAKTYYENEARGNSTYFKKKVKVTATITDISVDNSAYFNTGVTIHLKEKGAKYTMLCQNDDGIKGITNYSKDDKITVIGLMDTMVGSSLWMKECEIVD